jgi:hypothetical protein
MRQAATYRTQRRNGMSALKYAKLERVYVKDHPRLSS